MKNLKKKFQFDRETVGMTAAMLSVPLSVVALGYSIYQSTK